MRELLCENDDFMQKIDFVRVLPLVVLANTRNGVSLAVEAIIKNEGDHRVRSCELSADPGDSDAGGVHRDDHRGSFDLEFVAPPTQRMVAPLYLSGATRGGAIHDPAGVDDRRARHRVSHLVWTPENNPLGECSQPSLQHRQQKLHGAR